MLLSRAACQPVSWLGGSQSVLECVRGVIQQSPRWQGIFEGSFYVCAHLCACMHVCGGQAPGPPLASLLLALSALASRLRHTVLSPYIININRFHCCLISYF